MAAEMKGRLCHSGRDGVSARARLRRGCGLFLFGVAIAVTAPAVARGARPLPALELPALDGRLMPLRSDGAEVVVLNFWGTWCGPCLGEIPELVRMNRSWRRRGVRLLGVAIDSGAPEQIAAFAAAHHIDYTVLVADTGWLRQHFHIPGIPVTLVVDRNGYIRAHLVGPQTTAQLAAAVEPYLSVSN